LSLALFFCFAWQVAACSVATAADGFDRDQALSTSQAAIGNSVGDLKFVNAQGQSVQLSDYNGRPYVISMIFTSCHHICPTTTKHLSKSADAALDVLGDNSFDIITIGFDTAIDSPEAMRLFAATQGIDATNWQFLSGTRETIETLSTNLGFQFYPSARGFDHLNQLTVIDREGKVYGQVYGVNFELPWLVEPLKQLVFNRPESAGHRIASLVDRVRLFCTVYNPATGRYEIDNSLFFQIAIGFIFVTSVGFYLLREARRARRS